MLLIDLDSQASLTISVGLEPLEMERTIVDILKKDRVAASECIQQLNERLYIITSIIDLAPMEMELLSRSSREKILDRTLKLVRENFDYILADCPRRAIAGSMIEEQSAVVPEVLGRGRPKESRELKKRISLSVLPSVYEDIQKIAYVQRRSTSDLMEALMQKYRDEYVADLDEYQKIKG